MEQLASTNQELELQSVEDKSKAKYRQMPKTQYRK